MDETQSFSFGYHKSGDGQYDPNYASASRSVEMSEDDPWTKVMYQFCLFLSGVYGYDIADQIVVHNKYMGSSQSLTSIVFDQGGYSWPDHSDEDEDE